MNIVKKVPLNIKTSSVLSAVVNYSSALLQVIDTLQSRQALTDIESRHAEILKLEQDIRELKDLFCDMALLVENQVFN